MKTKEEFKASFRKTFISPYTEKEEEVKWIEDEEEKVIDIWESWGGEIGRLEKILFPILTRVVRANAGLLSEAGIPTERDASLSSPILDFSILLEALRTRQRLFYSLELETSVWQEMGNDLSDENIDQEVIARFPGVYDVWLQAILIAPESLASYTP